MLMSLTPTRTLINKATSMLKHAWDQRQGQTDAAKATLKRDIAKIETQQETLLDRLVETGNPKVIAAHEAKIAKLEEDKLRLTDQMMTRGKPHKTLDEIFELLRGFLSSPWNIYTSGDLHIKKAC